MDEYKIILEMLKLQQSLNDETNGPGWESGYTDKGKLISWRRCIYMECAELIDSFAWKHWKSINAKFTRRSRRYLALRDELDVAKLQKSRARRD